MAYSGTKTCSPCAMMIILLRLLIFIRITRDYLLKILITKFEGVTTLLQLSKCINNTSETLIKTIFFTIFSII